MSATLRWLDDQQSIVVCDLHDDFGTETYMVLEGQLPMQIRESSGRVDVILFLTKGAAMPPLRMILPEMGILINVMPPNFGVFVSVGEGFLLANPLSVAVGGWFLRVSRRYEGKVVIAGSLGGAQKVIEKLRLS